MDLPCLAWLASTSPTARPAGFVASRSAICLARFPNRDAASPCAIFPCCLQALAVQPVRSLLTPQPFDWHPLCTSATPNGNLRQHSSIAADAMAQECLPCSPHRFPIVALSPRRQKSAVPPHESAAHRAPTGTCPSPICSRPAAGVARPPRSPLRSLMGRIRPAVRRRRASLPRTR